LALLVETDGDRKDQGVSRNPDVASISKIYSSRLSRLVDFAVLVKIRGVAERSFAQNRNFGHIGEAVSPPFDRVKTSPLKTDLKFASNVLTMEVISSPSELGGRKC
jgi:hypothetical protein